MKLKNMSMTKIKTSKQFLFQHFTELQLAHLYPQMRGSNKEPIYDLSKGGLISESFSIWLKSPKKRCQITTKSTIQLKRFGIFFGSTSKKLSKIKLTLLICHKNEKQTIYQLVGVVFF